MSTKENKQLINLLENLVREAKNMRDGLIADLDNPAINKDPKEILIQIKAIKLFNSTVLNPMQEGASYLNAVRKPNN